MRNLIAGLGIIALLPASALGAAWQPGGVLVSGGPQEVQRPFVVADGTGGAFILWADFRNPNEPLSSPKSDVYCQRLTPTGGIAPGWPAAGLGVATRLGSDTPYGGVLDGAGGLFVLWTNSRGDGGDVYLQRIASTGTVSPGWPDTGRVLSAAAGRQHHAKLAPDGSGGVHVTWLDEPEFPVQGTAYRTHVLADGALAPGWPVNGRRHQPEVASAREPVMLPLSDGGFYGAWAEYSPDGFYSAARLVGARFDAAGGIAPGWPSAGVELCPMLPRSRTDLVLASDRAGGCFAVWSDERSATDDHDVYAQHLLPTATIDPRWPASGLVLSAVPNRPQWDVVACEDGEGGFIAAWEDYRIQPAQVHALRVRVDATHHPAWPAGGLRFDPDDAFQLDPRIVSDGMGGAYLAWNALKLVYEVHAQHLDGLGRPAPGWPEGSVRVFDHPAYQNIVALDGDGYGGAILAWEDTRNGAPAGFYDIYAQRYLRDALVSVRVSLVRAEATSSEVALEWQVEGERLARLERREGVGALWRELAVLESDGEGRMRHEDRDLTPGATLAYRLAFTDGTRSAEAEVSVPRALVFALEGARPHPAREHVTLAFTLAEPGEARLVLVDAAGRRVAERHWPSAEPGRHVVRFDTAARTPGLYWVVLTQGDRRESRRVVVVR